MYIVRVFLCGLCESKWIKGFVVFIKKSLLIISSLVLGRWLKDKDLCIIYCFFYVYLEYIYEYIL